MWFASGSISGRGVSWWRAEIPTRTGEYVASENDFDRDRDCNCQRTHTLPAPPGSRLFKFVSTDFKLL